MYLKVLDLVESAWEVMVFEAGIPLRIGYIGFSKDQLVVHAKTLSIKPEMSSSSIRKSLLSDIDCRRPTALACCKDSCLPPSYKLTISGFGISMKNETRLVFH